MADLISREAAKAAIRGKFQSVADRCEINEVLNGLSAVDAAPVVHARWIAYPECLAYEDAYHDEHIVCSACHSVWNIIDNDAERFNYCPNCGAKMDGERRESE